MPALSGNAATYRAGRYFSQSYIGSLPQTLIFSRAVNMASITYPVTNLVYDNPYAGTGVFGSVKEGMTVVVYSGNTSTVKGYGRVAAGAATSTVLQINEFSKGVINLADNDRFEVYETYSIWDKLVSASAALNKDSRTAYVAQGSDPPPIANAGGLDFGFVDDGQTYRTVTFDASVSKNVDPDSTTSKTYLWSVGDGTITVGTTTTSSITVRFPVGTRHVQLTVTDSGNSKATVRQIPVRVYNRTTTLPLAVSQLSGEYSDEDGWSYHFTLPKGSEAALSTLPDGALIVLFEDEYYAGTRGSYGSNVTDRSHIKFVGYLARDSISINPLNNEVSFDALSPLGILNKTPALPQLMVNTTSAGTKWRGVKTLTTNRMFWYLSHWHSTLDGYFDFVWQLTGSALAYRRIAVTEVSSIGAQLRDIAQSMNCKVTCDRLGRILVIQDFNYLSSANRSSRTVLYNFTTADIKQIDLTREHRGTVKFVRGEGITDGATSGSNKPCFSNGPGKAPAPFGTGNETLSRQIVDDQTDLNARTGWHFAKVNGLKDGLFVPQDVRITLPAGYDWIDPAYNEPVTLTLATSSNKRGVSFSTATRFLVNAASIRYDDETGMKENSYTISHETDGQPGTTYTKPQLAENNLPPFPPIDLAMPPLVFPQSTYHTPLVGGTGTIALFFLADTTFSLTTNFNNPQAAGGPSWASASPGTISGSFVSAIADPYSPLYLGTGNTVNGWLATTTRLYRLIDIFNAAGTRAASLQFIFPFTVATNFPYRVLSLGRNIQNFVVCTSYYRSTGGVYITRTTDGTNWTDAQLTAHYNATDDDNPCLWVSERIAGRVYTTAYTSTAGSSSGASLYRSDDYGATFNPVSGASWLRTLGRCLHMPWAQPTDRYIYFSKLVSGALQLNRFDLTTGIATDIAPLIATDDAGGWANGFAMDTAVNDINSVAFVGTRFSNATTAIYTTRNALASPPTWVQVSGVSAIPGRAQGVRFAPNSRDILYILGSDPSIVHLSTDFGVTLDNRTGTSVGQNYPIALMGG